MTSALSHSKVSRSPDALAVLTKDEHLLLELLSVFSEGAPTSTLTRALRKLGQRSQGHAPNNADTRLLLKRLTALGVLQDDSHVVRDEPAHQTRLAAAREGRFDRLAQVVRELRPARAAGKNQISTWGLAIRELRIELYARRWDEVHALIPWFPRSIFYDVCKPFDAAWIAAWPANLRGYALAGILEGTALFLEPAPQAFAMLAAEPELPHKEHRVLIENLVLRGQLDEAERQLTSRASLEAEVGRAWLTFLRGRTAESIAAYEAALKAYRKLSGQRSILFPDHAGLFYIVALIADGSPTSLTRATELTTAGARGKSAAFTSTYQLLAEVMSLRAGLADPEELLYINSTRDLPARDPIELLLQAAAARWTEIKLPKPVGAELEQRRARAEAAGLRWYAAQAMDILASADRSAPVVDVPGVRLATLLRPRERWADTLAALQRIATDSKVGKPASPEHPEADRRLVWIVSRTPYGIEINPREQARSKGAWSKGKPVALKRLSEEARQLGFLTPADLAACALIQSETTYEYRGRYANVRYYLDAARALRALAGSSNVLIEMEDGSFEPCEIRQSVPRLTVERAGAHLKLSLVPRPHNEDEAVSAVSGGPRTVEIVEFAPIHHAIARALGKKPLGLPSSGEGQLREVLSALSAQVAVHADLAAAAVDTQAVPGEPRPWFRLRALGAGLAVSGHVRPLGPEGPLARPGEGGATLFAQVAGQPAHATRDLAEESRRFQRARAACPTLAAGHTTGSDFVLPTRDQALTALLELRALGPDITLEWPDGEALQVSDPVDLDQLRLAIRSEAGDFLLRGALAIPGHADLTFPDLLDYLSASPSRFLRLAQEERYLALTDALRQRLDELLGVGDRTACGLRVHPLTAPLVADLLAAAQVTGDADWQRQVERFTVSGVEPQVPSTLRGELRPYQIEGFRWLVRLGQWGVGGCLADDMGLGKTLQAIALLLHRAPQGPALVVAPTSVVPTWVDEVQRFAPTLRVRTFAGPARAKSLGDLRELGPFDLLVTSYALLQIDIDALEQVTFATVVLDEAQAVKNAETRRARAAGRLRAHLRLATTGTPIENRLDELRSLFAFLNSGLLGSAQRFQERFAHPIERDQDLTVRDRLRRLVAPFVLRRTKTQVLPELPARTEVTLRVPLELEELALYEVIRQQALSDLERGDGVGPRRFQILAAIMRLRQAASNARLVLPDSKAPSAKLAALGELLDDLLPNQHKVLVFSQFVGHLALVKELLDERGVSYQYLDGSTPMAARKAAIAAFQAGQGEVFLISLKAGGFGLNLTAADYVVHMDPWWNPAVEDQASDRAHRIGQSRPVTIYRLVAQDTIEDRILGLHHRKRDLAAGILEGSDLAGSMSEAELLDLIRDPGRG